MTKTIYYEPRGTVHYNVHFKSGIRGLRPVDIDWIWIVELRRRASQEEIRKLCELHQQLSP